MPSLKGTRTEKNLLTAFAGESQARNRYNYSLLKPKKKAMNKLPRYLQKRLIMRRNMPSVSSNF